MKIVSMVKQGNAMNILIKLLAVLLLWFGIYASPLHALSCAEGSSQYYSSINKAKTACEADAEVLLNVCLSTGCTWGGVVTIGSYYWFKTEDPWGNTYFQHYYISDCAEGEIADEVSGACLAPPQLNEDDKKKIGCNKNPCGLGISPQVGH